LQNRFLMVITLFLKTTLDTYKISSEAAGIKQVTPITINETGIANAYDMEVMYKRHQNHSKIQWIDMKNGIIEII